MAFRQPGLSMILSKSFKLALDYRHRILCLETSCRISVPQSTRIKTYAIQIRKGTIGLFRLLQRADVLQCARPSCLSGQAGERNIPTLCHASRSHLWNFYSERVVRSLLRCRLSECVGIFTR